MNLDKVVSMVPYHPSVSLVLGDQVSWTITATRLLSQCSIAVKRHCDHTTQLSQKKAFKWGWLTISEVLSIFIVTGSMVA